MESGSNREDIERIIFCVFDAEDERRYNSLAPHFFPRSGDLPASAAGALVSGATPCGGTEEPIAWSTLPESHLATDVDASLISAAANSRISLYGGKVTSLDCSVLVYTTNKSFNDGSAISQYNATHADTDYAQERKQKLTKPGVFGDIRCTSGGALTCKYLYHVAGQEYTASQTRCRSKLCDVYTKCLDQAATRGDVKSICFLPLLVDLFNFPPAIACEVAVTSVRKW